MTSIPYIPAPIPPGVTSPSSMLNSGTSPAIGWTLSCQELIAPVLVPGRGGHEQAADARRRSGLPCLPCCRGRPGRRLAGNSGLPTYSCVHRRRRRRRPGRPPSRRRSPIPGAGCPRTARTCRSARTGISRIAKISSQLVSGVGFSNGWAELALKKPPPLLPSSLINSCDATGPRAMFCWRALECRHGLGRLPGLGHALPDEDEGADDRDRQEDVQDAAGQVDPVVADGLATLRRVRPRNRAMAMARPVAADVKLRTARTAAWVRYVAPLSPE